MSERIAGRPGLSTLGEDAAWNALRERATISLRPIGRQVSGSSAWQPPHLCSAPCSLSGSTRARQAGCACADRLRVPRPAAGSYLQLSRA